jgi:hypothetical protein
LQVIFGVSWAADTPCGDLNGSGVFDLVDIVRLNTATVTEADPADCDGAGTLACGDLLTDGVLDLSDLLIGLNHLAGNPTLFFCTGRGPARACGDRVLGRVTTNQVWPDCTGVGDGTSVLLDGIVIVEPGVTVTVEAGAAVKGISVRTGTTSGDFSILFVARGARLNAAGTAARPIVFTSDRPPGDRRVRDWAGVVLAGAAPVNFDGGIGSVEGFAAGLSLFGGAKPNDSSGILRFARIEFSGAESGDNEFNVLGLYGVGAGTIIDHVQANVGADDCFEWFGGTVDARHLVASNCRDDNFDFQVGWTGRLQYGLVVQNADIANDADGRHGVEGDNNELGFRNLPQSRPRLCNLTVVGAKDQTGGANLGADGARLRRGAGGLVSHAIFTEWSGDGIDVRSDGGTTCESACDDTMDGRYFPSAAGPANDAAPCPYDASFFAPAGYIGAFDPDGDPTVAGDADNNGAAGAADECDDTCAGWPCDPCTAWVGGCGLLENVDPGFRASPFGDAGLPATAADTIDGRYFPVAGGPADDVTPCGLGTAFFEPADYVGAFDPDGDPTVPGDANNWLLTTGGWISFAVH